MLRCEKMEVGQGILRIQVVEGPVRISKGEENRKNTKDGRLLESVFVFNIRAAAWVGEMVHDKV